MAYTLAGSEVQAWPFGGDNEAPETFDFPRAPGDTRGGPVHISVTRPPVISPATAPAYAAWIATYLPAQAGKPGRTVADLSAGVQTGTEQADFGQAKRYQYWTITGYLPESALARPANMPEVAATQGNSASQISTPAAANGSASESPFASAPVGVSPLALIALGLGAWFLLKGSASE